MSKRSRSSEPLEAEAEVEVEMRVNLNLSPTTSSSSSSSSSSASSLGSGSRSSVENSCLSCEEEDGMEEIITGSMMLVGCPGCFMYVMLTNKSSQCPKCNNTVFLDFFNQQKTHHA